MVDNGATEYVINSNNISNFENIGGSQGNDTLTGDNDSNAIFGGAGDDVLYGGAGDGDDILMGGLSSSRTELSWGSLRLNINFDSDDHPDAGAIFDHLKVYDTINIVEGLWSGQTSSDGEDVLYGQSGNDILFRRSVQ